MLSNNPNITWDIVQANPDNIWNYEWLFRKSQHHMGDSSGKF